MKLIADFGFALVSPGLIAGSGLKHLGKPRCRLSDSVSPGLIAGSGLKHPAHLVHHHLVAGISRLNRREWIETQLGYPIAEVSGCISRLNRREWIETIICRSENFFKIVSPGLIAGSGLKLSRQQLWRDILSVSPGLIAGSGLKPFGFPLSD